MADATFQLTDAKGVVHHYELDFHNAQQGAEISAALIQAGAPALLGVFRGFKGKAITELSSSDLDFGAIGDAVARTDLVKLSDRILANTRRDGKGLSASPNYDEAFRANYFELWQATVEAAKANNFLPELGTFLASASAPEKESPEAA